MVNYAFFFGVGGGWSGWCRATYFFSALSMTIGFIAGRNLTDSLVLQSTNSFVHKSVWLYYTIPKVNKEQSCPTKS